MSHWVGGVTHEEIARLAYRLWLDCERPSGHEVARTLWLRAEKMLQRPYW